MNQTAASPANQLPGPPKVALAFRVGVVGHRPNRLKNANEAELTQRLREILQSIQSAFLEHLSVKANADRYDGSQPQLRALSPLAEGVDRIFATEALNAGYSLTAVLPFPLNEYLRDFAPEKAMIPGAMEVFQDLLNRAETRFELDGTRGDESYAYQVAGEVVLNQSEILIVVWDFDRKNLRGGTEVILDTAVGRGIPVVLIDANAPHDWQLLTESRQLRRVLGDRHKGTPESVNHNTSSDLAELKPVILGLLKFPESLLSSKHGHGNRLDNPSKGWKFFLEERKAIFNPAILWKWFRDALGENRWRPPSMSVEPYEDAVTSEWPRQTDHPVARVIDRLRPFYAWPDKLADRYADGYRSAFVLSYLMAALAVAFALAPYALQMDEHSMGERTFAGFEFLAICLILIVVILGRSRGWHQRWLDYRLLAEIIRHQRLVAPLGGLKASPSVPAHLASYGNPALSWMGWYARALERSLGLPSARVDQEYLERSLADIQRMLEGQIDFHKKTAKRSEKIEVKLHLTEKILFGATLVCCLLHILGWMEHLHLTSRFLTFFCGFFPVLGASLAGIINQGEFRRIEQQSRSMAERLQLQLNELNQFSESLANSSQSPKQWSAEIASVATVSARIMVDEVLGYRVIFQDQPLKTT